VDAGGFNVNWFKLEQLEPIPPDITPPVVPTAAFDETTGKTIFGVAEVGSTVVVKDSAGAEIGTAIADASTGSYLVNLTAALINQETVEVTARDAAGNDSSAAIIVAPLVTVSNPTPTVIQAENYTSMSGVQTENTSDVGGGLNAGWLDTGDWMAYSNAAINVPTGGHYRITYRVASLNGGGRLTLKELSTDTALGSISVPKTSGWQNWVDVTQEITLNSGEHNFKLAVDAGGFNVNWFKLEQLEPMAKVIPAEVRVEQLIQAMASFAPPSGIETNVISRFDDRSNNLIAVGQ